MTSTSSADSETTKKSSRSRNGCVSCKKLRIKVCMMKGRG